MQLVRKYVYGPGIDEPVRMSGPKKYYYHTDGNGNITVMTDSGGFTVEKYSYDVYGNVAIVPDHGNGLSDPIIGNRLMFQGRDRDPDTGLYNFRHRDYSPALGRFMQPDPARLAGGLNLYASFYNNPVNYCDPMGFCITDQVPNLMGPLPQPNPSDPLSSLNHLNNPPGQNPFDPNDTLSGISDPELSLQVPQPNNIPFPNSPVTQFALTTVRILVAEYQLVANICFRILEG